MPVPPVSLVPVPVPVLPVPGGSAVECWAPVDCGWAVVASSLSTSRGIELGLPPYCVPPQPVEMVGFRNARDKLT